MDRVRALPARLDDDTLASVEGWLAKPIEPLPPADRNYVLEFAKLLADMPRRSDSDTAGTVRKEALVEHLSGLPRAQLDWLRYEARLKFQFFPTVKELMDLAGKWERGDELARARRMAATKVYRELQARAAECRKKLKYERCEQDWIDGLPESLKRILRSEGVLHRCPDCGSYTQRPGWREYQAFVAQMKGEAA